MNSIHTEPNIIFEDDNCLVIDKPVGWLVHEDGKTDAPTVVGWFLGRAPEARDVGEEGYAPGGKELNRSGVVHRLDRDTSGIMILAKNQEAHAHLKAQFQDRVARKEYRAFVYGRMNERWGSIDRPIGRSANDPRKRSAMPGAKGDKKKAITAYETIGSGEYKGETFSCVKLLPKTGRTHQLRVHLRAIDRPIVCDEIYSSHLIENSNNLGLKRLALHSHVLEIALPGEDLTRFISQLPTEFERAAESLAG